MPPAADWDARLDDLLRDGETALRRLDPLRAAVRSRPPVLFGAGMLGRAALAGFRTAGVEPVAFADNNPGLWGREVDGLRVVRPADAKAAFPAAPFVVTVYTSAGLRAGLRADGLTVVPFAAAALEYADFLLPHTAIDRPARVRAEADAVRAGLHAWADDESRAEYLAQVRYRLTLDDAVPPPLPVAGMYFPDDLVRPVPDEVFVDCGAYTGDSVRGFLAHRGGVFGGVVAVEPDPAQCGRLREYVAALPADVGARVRVVEAAVGADRGVVTFGATGTMASAVAASAMSAAAVGTPVTVPLVPLDDILSGDRPSYVKMDVEGAEPDALRGAAGVIRRFGPVLAVCLYHRQNDLWTIPLQIRALRPDYRLFLRRYGDDCWEQVCYGVPPDRVPG